MHDIIRSVDFYHDEYEQFQRDVYLLIEGTLNASKKFLGDECETELTKIKTVMDKTHDAEHHSYLEDDYGDVLLTNISQERFLRNMALVALASRLTHALRNMSKSAESFSPRTDEHKKRYKKTHLSEFQRLWLEYRERFGIDFVVHKDRIAFVDVMNDVRNQIVHEGAEAETFKFLYEFDANDANPQYMDTSFADKYPDYVSEDGSEVNVSEQQLKDAIDASVKLVAWLASELRTKELAHIKAAGMAPQ
ncbi:MAG TPA: hypothetical protein VFE08_15185 [Candidatus Sulfotelmatobacter sp.]|jgi:hypothetical protein|nr:hypothetical protein [Candidatus Sulfotelmatobacter sp.]